MGSDVSRVRFNPLRDFAGVVLQQGRLLLDADFNEYVELLDRRLRAETCDLTSFGPDPGHAGVSWVPRQTPDAFRLTVAASGITIGRGRMYVDGLLAENHGLPPLAFDALLSEETGNTSTPWDDQPYGPTPEETRPDGNGVHLAYLDVWQREVTHLEDPELVEVAVGVDTTSRLQTAWQVRLLPNVGAITCDTDDEDIPGWLDVIRPSGGRLTTDTVDDDDTDDPCDLPPVAGYSGLENQTYRVEIHEGGAPGTATFKWSRDNGSVAIPVLDKVSSTSLRLASVGKDDVLRVSTGDWVEILDDTYELRRKPGEVRKVTVDDAARTITFTGALTADLLPANAADAADRHVRVRRWDQAGVVRSGAGATLVDLDAAGSTGLITVPPTATTQVVLEHRVAVSFSIKDGGEYKEGDHWIFAARTADASVEPLDEAPPDGVHHHYARLGVVTFPDTVEDCRRLWPPLGGEGESCDCTVCVTPESHRLGSPSIQDAINQVVAAGGGTVCLAAGVYDIGPGLRIERARSVRLRGQGPATILAARGTALRVEQSAGIAVERLAIVSGEGAPAAVRVRTVAGASLSELIVLSYGSKAGSSAIELSGIGLLVSVRENVLVARTPIDAGLGDKLGLLAAGLRVEDNVAFGFDNGIDLGGAAAYLYACRVSGNDVFSGRPLALLPTRSGGIVATGAVARGGSLDIVENKIATAANGIVAGPDVTVDGNTINRLGRENGTDGILIASGPIAMPRGHIRITGNRIYDRDGTGIRLTTAVRSFVVKQNVIDGATDGIVIMDNASAERVSIENNQVFVGPGFTGIAIGRAVYGAIVGNTVVRTGGTSMLESGIWSLGVETVRISGNLVDMNEAEEGDAFAAGISVYGPFERALVTDNVSRFGPEGAVPPGRGWSALDIVTANEEPKRAGDRFTVVPIRTEELVIGPSWAFALPARRSHVDLSSNMFSGGGAQGSCIVRVGGDVVAQGNQFAHAGDDSAGGVALRGSSVTATSNRVRGRRAMLVLEMDPRRIAAVGNLASGGTHLTTAGGGLPAPWDVLNPTVS